MNVHLTQSQRGVVADQRQTLQLLSGPGHLQMVTIVLGVQFLAMEDEGVVVVVFPVGECEGEEGVAELLGGE